MKWWGDGPQRIVLILIISVIVAVTVETWIFHHRHRPPCPDLSRGIYFCDK